MINPRRIDEPHIHVVAAIVWQTESRKRFLIAQRPPGKHLEGYWEFPGGKLEAGETPVRALERELEEEISIRVERAEPLMRVYYRYPQRNILLDTWEVTRFAGQLQGREGQALQWIGIAEIDNYRFPPADRPVLEAITNSATARTRRLP